MRVAFDVNLGRPGCVLVAALMGCDTRWLGRVPSSTWLTVPTEDMAVYEATPEQVDILVRRLNASE